MNEAMIIITLTNLVCRINDLYQYRRGEKQAKIYNIILFTIPLLLMVSGLFTNIVGANDYGYNNIELFLFGTVNFGALFFVELYGYINQKDKMNN